MSGATRVLVIDDEPQIVRFLKPALTAAGYEVTSAAPTTTCRSRGILERSQSRSGRRAW